MNSLKWRLQSCTRYQKFQDDELDRLAILRQKPAPTPPEIIKPTKIKRIGRAFRVSGKEVQMGEVVEVARNIAADLIAMGRAASA